MIKDFTKYALPDDDRDLAETIVAQGRRHYADCQHLRRREGQSKVRNWNAHRVAIEPRSKKIRSWRS